MASYKVKNKNEEFSVKSRAFSIINQIAEANQLKPDKKYIHTDTLGFFGQPYHYFKFWIVPEKEFTIINFDYWGTHTNRKKTTYQNFFNQTTDSLKTNFILLEKKENNF